MISLTPLHVLLWVVLCDALSLSIPTASLSSNASVPEIKEKGSEKVNTYVLWLKKIHQKTLICKQWGDSWHWQHDKTLQC